MSRREIFGKAGILERWRNGATLSRRRGKLAILTNGSLYDGGQGCQGGEKSEKLSANPGKGGGSSKTFYWKCFQ